MGGSWHSVEKKRHISATELLNMKLANKYERDKLWNTDNTSIEAYYENGAELDSREEHTGPGT